MGLFCNSEILSKHYNTYYTASRKYKMHGHEILIRNNFIPVFYTIYYLKYFIKGKKYTNVELGLAVRRTLQLYSYFKKKFLTVKSQDCVSCICLK